MLCGIDEAGRGPWAGPVDISAFILTKNNPVILGANDSKQI
ncbi:MAG: ribonuclease HII, partial [Sulfurimonas sp.]